MSYRIEYDAAVGKYEVRKVSPGAFPLFMLSAFMIVAILTYQGRELFRSLIIPGDDAVTLQAFHMMTADLYSGAAFWDAFSDFCRLVIHGV